ncbi:MAG: AMP-binding protein [Bacteroidales bacterium]|nr:AMP-binding protein [Bacteroidales bacterium]
MINFVKRFEGTIKDCWDKPALTEFRSETITYGELAKIIETNHLYFAKLGLCKGDKIAINAKSSAEWAKIFMSAVTGGYVAVQLFNGYTPEDTKNLVNHSDSKIFFTEKQIVAKMDFEQMPCIYAAIDLHSGEILASRGDFEKIYNSKYQLLAEAYPNGFSAADVNFGDIDLDEICGINYTSGSTGSPKGVMLTFRNFSANVEYVFEHLPYRRGDNYVSVLPYAHIFGLTCDMITPLSTGLHLVVLFFPPVPQYLKPAMVEYKPRLMFAVPLILTKYSEYTIGEFIHSKSGKEKLANYEENPDFCDALNTIFLKSLGGNLEMIATGGAAIPSDLEELLCTKLKSPFITGYGMTECAPVIAVGEIGKYKLKSVGFLTKPFVEGKIASQEPKSIPGELLVRGDIVFKGYYKNEAATKAAFTEDGWFRTGDMGVIDEDGVLFLMGRCKNMILTSNGQNIFPEEIEVVLNTLPYVAESLVVERNGKLVALIVPNADQVTNSELSAEALDQVMKSNIAVLNTKIPGYSQVGAYELQMSAFAKTPKGSIKRFMYK